MKFITPNVSSQALHELKKSRNWAGLHVADNSCFHYRRVSLLMLGLEMMSHRGDSYASHSLNLKNGYVHCLVFIHSFVAVVS